MVLVGEGRKLDELVNQPKLIQNGLLGNALVVVLSFRLILQTKF